MSRWAVFAWLAACATPGAPIASDPPTIETIWQQVIRPGDLIVAVPGTGGYTDLGAWIDAAYDPAHPSALPVIDGRVEINPIVLEQAIAAATRAGLSSTEIEAGAVALGLWGSGATKP